MHPAEAVTRPDHAYGGRILTVSGKWSEDTPASVVDHLLLGLGREGSELGTARSMGAGLVLRLCGDRAKVISISLPSDERSATRKAVVSCPSSVNLRSAQRDLNVLPLESREAQRGMQLRASVSRCSLHGEYMLS